MGSAKVVKTSGSPIAPGGRAWDRLPAQDNMHAARRPRSWIKRSSSALRSTPGVRRKAWARMSDTYLMTSAETEGQPALSPAP